MSRNPKTTDFLKECMADSLLQLMKRQDYTKITINEIAVSAGVNRSTWFRNFSSKSDALTFKVVLLWYRWLEQQGLPREHRYTLDDAGSFFRFTYENRNLLHQIYACNLQSTIYEAFYQIIMPQHPEDPLECYYSRFYSYALFGLLNEWIKRDFCETPEEMTFLLHNIISNP